MAQIGVFATVLDALGRVLLCHRADADYWGQPGGGVVLRVPAVTSATEQVRVSRAAQR